MKKFLQRSIGLALCLTAVSLSACGETATGTLPPYGGVEGTGFYLSQAGNSDYSIVIAKNASEYETFGAQELQTLFKEATGATLPIVTDDSVTYSQNAKVISIGDNAFQKASGITVDFSVFKNAGNRVVSKGSSVILLGGSDRGSLYAVYDFLSTLVDYEYYEEFAYTIKRNATLELPVLDEKNIPAFDEALFSDYSHYISTGKHYYNAWRQRFHYSETASALAGHTAAQLIPLDTYYEKHPEWFSSAGDDWQLCYTNEEMMLEYIERCKYYIETHPLANEITLTENDINSWCTCASCTQVLRSYDLYDGDGKLLMAAPNSLTGVIFKSRVADALDKWLAEEYPERHYTYVTYAYFQQRTPPVYRDPKTGEFIVLTNGKADDPLKSVNPNLRFQVAAIEATRNLSWEDNTSQGEELKRWAKVSPNAIVYEYPQDAANVLLPFDGLHVHADNIRYAYSLGHQAYKYQGNHNTQSGGFYDLRKYVTSKLCWDPTLDVDTLVNNYLKVTCGPAAPYMAEVLTVYRTRMAKLREENSYGGHVLGNNLKAGNWPRDLMVNIDKLFLDAFEALETLKYNAPEKYEAYFRRVKIEHLTVQYINLSLYRSYYSIEDKNALIDEFEEFSKKYGAVLYHESKPMADVISQWRKS